MIVEHHRPVLQLDSSRVGRFHHSQDELRLSSGHGGVEASRVHPVGVEVLPSHDAPVHPADSFEG